MGRSETQGEAGHLQVPERTREALAAWRAECRGNAFTRDRGLEVALGAFAGPDQLARWRPELVEFGAVVGSELAEHADRASLDENLPRLEPYDGIGERTEGLALHPSYDRMGELVFGARTMADYRHPGQEALQLAKVGLAAQLGEAPQLCPLACTAGLIKALQQVGSEELKERYLEGLLEPDYARNLVGAQFVTEVQGGSDVGAGAVEAHPDPEHPGTFRIHGEKWFCSVIHADLFLLSARVPDQGDGTRGLGCFLVPRRLPDGSLNAFRVRRLKRKLGTRAMPSGEVDWLGSRAYPIGALEEGFQLIVGVVLQTSRVFNAVVTAGSMTRAFLDAESYARHRSAFGRPIRVYPEIRRTLARMKTEAWGALHASLHVISLADRLARGEGSDHDRSSLRMLTNGNKYWTSIRNTQVVRDGIEVMGGNGAIEDFSHFPRLLRDALVLESWEGAHNVLCNQMLRDCLRYHMHEPMLVELQRLLEEDSLAPDNAAPDPLRAEIQDRLEDLEARYEELVSLPPEVGTERIRCLVDRTAVCHQAATLYHASRGPAGDPEARRVLPHLLALHPGRGFEGTPLDLVDACLEGSPSGGSPGAGDGA